MDESKVLNNDVKTDISDINEHSRSKEEVTKLQEEMRNSGSDIIGNISWGTHLCQFYQSKEDLIDILVPYFKAGLESNEFCMWVCWDPLRAEEARTALSKTLGNLDNYVSRGQIEIVDYSKRYIVQGDSGFDNMKQFWIEKEKLAFERGFEGLRLAGNTYWLERNEWEGFTKYEEEVDEIIRGHKMLAICPYCLDKCGASEVIDVVGNHKSALIRREGKWELIEGTERKKVEEKLKIYRAGVESAYEGIVFTTMDGDILAFNNASCRIFGYTPAEMKKINISKFSANPSDEKKLEESMREKGRFSGGIVGVRKNGETFPAALSVSVIKDNKGRPAGRMGVFTDITERKKAEETLRDSEEFAKRVIESSNDCIKVLDLNGNLLSMSRGGQKLLEIDDITPYLNRPFVDFWKGKDREAALEAISKTKKGDVGIFYGYCETAKGIPKWWEIIISPIKDYHGNIDRLLAVSRDITERKKMIEEIKNLAKFPEENANPVYRTSKDGVLLYANPASRRLILEDQTKIGDKIPKKWFGMIKNVYDSGKRQQVELELSGRVFLFNLVPLIESGYINSYATDITERKKAEEALRQQKLSLEQKNLALKEMVEHIERTKNKTKEDIVININESVLPILKKLKIKGESSKYINLLQHHLEELTSSFGRRITEKSIKLTPREIEICNMIKGGLTSKEASKLLNISYQTIERHRKNIRKKLGISNKRVNLTSYLQRV